MKNKILSVIMVATMAISLVACGTSTKEVATTPSPSEEVETTETVEVAEVPEVLETDLASTSADVEANASESTEVAESTETEMTEPVDTAPKTPTYTYEEVSKTLYAKSSVNVRSGPSTDFDKLGGISTNDEVTVTGKCNETGWYRIEYKGSTAYVSDSYLVSEKVNVEPPADNGSGNSGGQSSGGNWYDSYVKNQWIDMTNCFIYINTTGAYVNHDDNVQNTLLARFPGSIVNYWTIRTYKDGTQVWAYMYTYGDPMDSTSYSKPSIP